MDLEEGASPSPPNQPLSWIVMLPAEGFGEKVHTPPFPAHVLSTRGARE